MPEKMPKRKFWGWGYEGGGPTAAEVASIAEALTQRFGVAPCGPRSAPRIEEIELRASRATPPSSLESILSNDPEDRAAHTYGKSFRDVARAYARDFANPPDVVARPSSEADVAALLDWCHEKDLIAIPFGGGSSVVGGTEAPSDDPRPVVTIDLGGLDRVLEIDQESHAARIQAGVFGPALEDQLRPHGLTLRHFPQSFEFSTLGGWLATRSGGHFATLHTHIDDFVESMRVWTPTGVIESRRLPGSGAGPSPDRLFLGSEGTLGIITEAWMRLQDRPDRRASASIAFTDFERAVQCVRLLSQSGLHPSNCRLLDHGEALTSGAGDGSSSILVLGFESADHDPAARMQRALEVCREAGGTFEDGAGATRVRSDTARDDAEGAWRSAFLSAPYLRDSLVGLGVISETFETATTWDRFPALHAAITDSVRDALRRICGAGTISCRFTHVYPDGPAPYYTVLAPGKPEALVEQWSEIKAAASEALIAAGGTITHHHAVGRDHRPWYDRQRPEGFARALRAAKSELDPKSILNPGVLIDPVRPANS
jgi:alkyldihydroxyacetonephosphate synthase